MVMKGVWKACACDLFHLLLLSVTAIAWWARGVMIGIYVAGRKAGWISPSRTYQFENAFLSLDAHAASACRPDARSTRQCARCRHQEVQQIFSAPSVC